LAVNLIISSILKRFKQVIVIENQSSNHCSFCKTQCRNSH